jgi:hypothetical protein
MTRIIGIGSQNFEQIISNRYFCINKTSFIKEWWENGDAVTLIARPEDLEKPCHGYDKTLFFCGTLRTDYALSWPF